MKHYIFLTLILLILPNTLTAQISSGGAFSLEKSAVATGGGDSSSGAFSATGTTGQNAVGTITAASQFNQFGGFWTYDQIQPTAANVSIGGNVKTSNGNGIRNVIVILTDVLRREPNDRDRLVRNISFHRCRSRANIYPESFGEKIFIYQSVASRFGK